MFTEPREVLSGVWSQQIEAEKRGQKRGHSSFLLLFATFPTGFYGNMMLCQKPHELPSEGFATTF